MSLTKKQKRRFQMKKVAAICMLVSVLLFFSHVSSIAQEQDNLLIHVTLCMKGMYENLVKQFSAETGVKVTMSSLPDGQMINQIKVHPEGDVVQVGAGFFMERIDEHVEYVKPVCKRSPVIVVPSGNPANVRTLQDFTNKGVEAVICDVETSGMGRVSKAVFDKGNLFEEVKPNIVNSPKSSAIMMPLIKLRQANAGICWQDVTVHWIKNKNAAEDIEMVEIPKEYQVTEIALIAVLKNSKNKPAAKQFVDWIISPQRAETFIGNGFPIFLAGRAE
jgi:ABC-type molybdate transport system substrate-binding protein